MLNLAHVWTIPLATALALVGCGPSKKDRIKPAEMLVAKDATAEQLIVAYNQQADAVRSLNARVELNPVAGSAYSGVIEDYRDVRGFILAQKPSHVRMIGQAPVVATTVFDMVSDGETFRISVPPKHKFITGPTNLRRETEKPIENLRPQHLVDALFWPELPVSAGGLHSSVLFEEQDERSPANGAITRRFYVITLLADTGPREVARKIWFDRANLNVTRLQAYEPGGRLATDVTYSEWQPADAVASGEAVRYPRFLRIARPQDDYRLDLRITKLTVNESIAAERFRLEQPQGAELVQLTNKSGEKRP
ncbi:MAG: hypothetical protein ACRD5G_13845 [Candidatus Acidiferrales bacterium]